MNSSAYMILEITLFFLVPLVIVLIRRKIIKNSIKIEMSADPSFLRRNGSTLLSLKLRTGYNLMIKNLLALLVCIKKTEPDGEEKRCVEESYGIEEQIKLTKNELSVFKKRIEIPHYLGEESGSKEADGKTETYQWLIEVKMSTEVGEIRDSIPIKVKGSLDEADVEELTGSGKL
ncbi:MAG: hypothetical protein K8T10_16695 [Candidatus Eremiobacteraeota bacterium]|nr:hypothetical protein [Candidatus Eremiobacteraeota bacterium]